MFRTAWTPLGAGNHSGTLATRSEIWVDGHSLSDDWYLPDGFASNFFLEGAPQDGSAGTANISYSVTIGS
jgi:hypothetical protein